jgi:hypothetical protein
MTILPIGIPLRQTISKIVDSVDSIIKIQSLDNQVSVNHRTIYQRGYNFVVSNRAEQFFLKKSAVAFAVCLEYNDHNAAKQIKTLDSKYQKLTMCNRISECSPNLYAVKHELTRALKSIKIA